MAELQSTLVQNLELLEYQVSTPNQITNYVTAISTEFNTIFLHKNGIEDIGEINLSGDYTQYGTFSQGDQTSALGPYSHAEGLSSIANGKASHAEGGQTSALGSYSHAEGRNCIAIGGEAHAEGDGCKADGYASHAEGVKCYANAQSHAEGNNCKAEGYQCHAEGLSSIARGKVSHAEGYKTSAIGNYSHSAGIDLSVEHDYSWGWNGYRGKKYYDNGIGTFNINPKNGLSGFYIGEENFISCIVSAIEKIKTDDSLKSRLKSALSEILN